MDKFWKWLIPILLMTAPLTGEVCRLSTMESLDEHIDENTLILFDIDNTLLQTVSSWGQPDWFYHSIKKSMEQGLSKHEAMLAFYPRWNRARRHCRESLCETMIPSLIAKYQQEGLKVMAVTHRQPEISTLTVKRLYYFGIDFAPSSLSHRNYIIEIDGHASKLFEGVLFVSHHNDKIEVLSHFLDSINYRPKKVVFIDDTIDYLFTLDAYFKKREIPFTGFHYTYVADQGSSFDHTVADFQEAQFGSILSDDQARALYESLKD